MTKMFDMKQLDNLLEDIGCQLPTLVETYIIGGFAMMKNGMKVSTKDVDIVFQTEKDAMIFINTALENGFFPDKELPEEYKELEAITILKDNDQRRFDIFVKQVLRGLVLTPEMWKRAKRIEYKNLAVSTGAKEDIFLFKSITSRPADLEDMQQLAETGAMDWNTIIKEANNQPTPWLWIGRLYGRLKELEEKTNITTPITKKLEPEAEIAAAIAILLSKLETRPLSLQDAATILQEDEEAFVKNVLTRMEQNQLITKKDTKYLLK